MTDVADFSKLSQHSSNSLYLPPSVLSERLGYDRQNWISDPQGKLFCEALSKFVEKR